MKVPEIKDYPKKIYIRGDVYRIVFIKNLKELGVTSTDPDVIKIKAGMSKNETFKTFIHEVLHAMEFSWPIELSHKTVYRLEEAIFSLLIDNFFN